MVAWRNPSLLCISTSRGNILGASERILQDSSENDSDRKFSKSKFFKVFLETTFVHVSCYPDHYEPKIFFSVFEVRCMFLDSRVTLCNAISEGRPPLSNMSSEAGALDTGGTSRERLGPKTFKLKFFEVFLKTTFFHDSGYPVHY